MILMPVSLSEQNRARSLFEGLLSEGKKIRFTATGTSMAPVIRSGDRVVVMPAFPDSVAMGDIVLFRQPGARLALHRVLRVIRDNSGRARRFLTKGDAFNIPDSPVMAEDIIGRAVLVETTSLAGVKHRRLDTPVAARVAGIMGIYHRLRSNTIRFFVAHKPDSASDKPDSPAVRRCSAHIFHSIQLGRHGKTPPYFPDWPQALRIAFAENLQGFMLKAAPCLHAPRGVVRMLENAYFTCLAQNIRTIEAIKELEPYLEAKGISAMVFKGAALIGSTYEDPGLRPMEDIDLMARPGEQQGLMDVLRQAGFVLEPHFPGLFVKDTMRIDLHVHPLNADRVAARADLLGLDSAALFSRSLPFRPGMTHVRRPSDADHVLILAQHIVKHSFSKLIWLEDIRRLVGKQDFSGLVRLNQVIHEYRQARPMAYASYLSTRIMGKPLYSPEISISPPFVRFTRLEKALLNLRVSGRSMGDWGHLLWIFCLPDKRLYARFCAQMLFPAPKALARENPGSTGQSRRLLYARRSVRIARRFMPGFSVLISAFKKNPH